MELEYEADPPLDPRTLLGEPDTGQRGAHQTSPDVAFIVRTTRGRGLILTENKYTEHHFYRCSGRKPDAGNPDSHRCLQAAVLDELDECHQRRWDNGGRPNRKYWDHLSLTQQGRSALRRCPAATDGYQLFRQQALAEAIAASGRYEFVMSTVAFDHRNEVLRRCLRTTGIPDFTTGWAPLFDGKARFATFSHQEWVAHVAANDHTGRWRDWAAWMAERYDYGNA